MENTVDKVIITVVGKDTVGIIAKVCTYLSENDCGYESVVENFRGLPEGSGCSRGADRRVHQMSEGRDF